MTASVGEHDWELAREGLSFRHLFPCVSCDIDLVVVVVVVVVM